MQHYHLCDHIYLAQFRNELIVLDLERNKYTIYPRHFANMLLNLVNTEFSGTKDDFSIYSNAESKNLYVEKLIQNNILELRDVPYPFYIERKLNSAGVSNVDWRLPLEHEKIVMSYGVVAAFITLLKVNFYIKAMGFYQVIQLIRTSWRSDLKYIIPSEPELRDLAQILNKACLIYPVRTKCLEWAITFVLLSLKRGWKCNLEIGVQNYPFMAHAWVECDGKVVMDSQEHRSGLAIILNEPFRRVKV